MTASMFKIYKLGEKLTVKIKIITPSYPMIITHQISQYQWKKILHIYYVYEKNGKKYILST